MSPYARALGDTLRLPVYDIYSFITGFHAGLNPRDLGIPPVPRGPGRSDEVHRAADRPDGEVHMTHDSSTAPPLKGAVEADRRGKETPGRAPATEWCLQNRLRVWSQLQLTNPGTGIDVLPVRMTWRARCRSS